MVRGFLIFLLFTVSFGMLVEADEEDSMGASILSFNSSKCYTFEGKKGTAHKNAKKFWNEIFQNFRF
jgi:hypothetical protein